MGAFREALHALRPVGSGSQRLPVETLTRRAAERLGTLGVPVPLRPAKDYDRVAREMLDKISARDELSGIELRDGAWCLWETTPALADEPGALGAVLAGIAQAERPRPLRALASSYLKSFDPSRAGMEMTSGVLTRGAPRMGRLWQGLELRFNLFDIHRGPRTIADEALSERVAPSEQLRRFGLASADARSGFARFSSAEALLALGRDSGRDALDRLHLSEKVALDDGGRLIFDEHGPRLVQALLEPFGAEMPAKHIRDPYLDVLLRLFGDPRLAPGRWVSMPAGEATVRRWLTEQSLRQFLEIIGKVADPSMWLYRRKFWEAVYRADLIHDAWVVFDNAGARLARQAYGKHVSFGTFSGTVAEGQAILLMKIGRGIVAEWSHNGRCNIWRDAQDRSAPLINQRSYDPRVLRGLRTQAPPVDWTFQAFTHDAPGHRWREKVATRIRDMTGFTLTPQAYL